MHALEEVQVWLPHVHWGIMIAVYLFLGGVAGGSYLTGYAADLLVQWTDEPEERDVRAETTRWGMIVAIGAIVVGLLALLSHLGGPFRAMLFPVTLTNYSSWMTRGTWVLVVFTLVTAIQAFWYTFGSAYDEERGASLFPRTVASWMGSTIGWPVVERLDSIADRSRPSRMGHLIVGALGCAIGVGVIVYTGLLLSVLWTVPLWNPTILPILFLTSGVSTGIAATVGITAIFEGLSETIHQLSLADDALIAIEIGVIWLLLRTLHDGGAAAAHTLEQLNGALAPFFWGGILLLGLLVPLIASIVLTVICYRFELSGLPGGIRRALAAGFVGKFALVLLGGLLLRGVILFAAVKRPLHVVGVGF